MDGAAAQLQSAALGAKSLAPLLLNCIGECVGNHSALCMHCGATVMHTPITVPAAVQGPLFTDVAHEQCDLWAVCQRVGRQVLQHRCIVCGPRCPAQQASRGRVGCPEPSVVVQGHHEQGGVEGGGAAWMGRERRRVRETAMEREGSLPLASRVA
jgi:hypothetical protein